VDFVKMEGLGNDFVVLAGPFSPTPDQVSVWCDRRRGIGADGVLVVTPVDRSTVAMGYWNADGSAAEMCGNGLRCIGRYAVDHGLVAGTDLTVLTPAGPREVTVADDTVRAHLGTVTTAGEPVDVGGYRLEPVSVGNPHAVAFVPDCWTVLVAEGGPMVETDPAFSGGTNVEFATVVSPERIDLRVWERGVGETLACGTGAAAAVAAAHRSGLTGSEVEVHLPGGVLRVEIVDGEAWIEGPANEVFRGVLSHES
jgi:diaminopimelate epimerase